MVSEFLDLFSTRTTRAVARNAPVDTSLFDVKEYRTSEGKLPILDLPKYYSYDYIPTLDSIVEDTYFDLCHI